MWGSYGFPLSPNDLNLLNVWSQAEKCGRPSEMENLMDNNLYCFVILSVFSKNGRKKRKKGEQKNAT